MKKKHRQAVSKAVQKKGAVKAVVTVSFRDLAGNLTTRKVKVKLT
ncbi:hypothetical protein [Nocardioides alcanivorans]|nr:hypothetical protein [Nocardioides alcanivorans]